jgi:hypothetical protein
MRCFGRIRLVAVNLVGFCRFPEPHAGVLTHAERLPFNGSGNEPGVDWWSTEETYQVALVINSIENCGTDSIRVVH